MEGKGTDTEDEFEDLLEDAKGDFPDKPREDPPPYKPPANPDTEIALSPAPQGGVISAELLEDSVEIKKLNEKVDGLEEKIRICCPEKPDKEKEKIKPKRDVKYDYKTRGWIAIRGGSAYSGNIGPLSGPRDKPRKRQGRPGKVGTRKGRKNDIVEMGLVGYSERNAVENQQWYPRDQTQDPDEMLKNTIKESHSDQYIAPGVSLHLIKQKIKEGFVIEFEDPLDAREMDQLMGAVSGYKKKKKKKRSSKKKKSRRSSKKKKKSRRSSKKKKKSKKNKSQRRK